MKVFGAKGMINDAHCVLAEEAQEAHVADKMVPQFERCNARSKL